MDLTIDYIQKVTSDYFNIPIDSLQLKTRKREILQARQIAMYFSKLLTKSSLASIGAQIGNKDHATVLHACKTVNNLYDTDKFFRNDVDEIEKRIKEVKESIKSKPTLKQIFMCGLINRYSLSVCCKVAFEIGYNLKLICDYTTLSNEKISDLINQQDIFLKVIDMKNELTKI